MTNTFKTPIDTKHATLNFTGTFALALPDGSRLTIPVGATAIEVDSVIQDYPDDAKLHGDTLLDGVYFNGRKIPCHQLTITGSADNGYKITVVGDMSADRSSGYMDLLVRGEVVGALHLVAVGDAPRVATLNSVVQNLTKGTTTIHTVLTFVSVPAKDAKQGDLAPAVSALKDLADMAEPLRGVLSSTPLDRDHLAFDFIDRHGARVDNDSNALAKDSYEFADAMIRASHAVPADVKMILDGCTAVSRPADVKGILRPAPGEICYLCNEPIEPGQPSCSSSTDRRWTHLPCPSKSSVKVERNEAVKLAPDSVHVIDDTTIADITRTIAIHERTAQQFADAVAPVRAPGSTVLGVLQKLVTFAFGTGARDL